MNAVEIIALIFALIIVLKLIMLFTVNTKFLIKFIEKMYKNQTFLLVFALMLLVVLGYFLLQTMTIVQIFAASMFGVIVYGLALLSYSKTMIKLMKEVLKEKKKLWLSLTVWLVLVVWVFIKLFF